MFAFRQDLIDKNKLNILSRGTVVGFIMNELPYTVNFLVKKKITPFDNKFDTLRNAMEFVVFNHLRIITHYELDY
jgi:hypothetical protein